MNSSIQPSVCITDVIICRVSIGVRRNTWFNSKSSKENQPFHISRRLCISLRGCNLTIVIDHLIGFSLFHTRFVSSGLICYILMMFRSNIPQCNLFVFISSHGLDIISNTEICNHFYSNTNFTDMVFKDNRR